MNVVIFFVFIAQLVLSVQTFTFEQCCDLCTHGCKPDKKMPCKCLEYRREFLAKTTKTVVQRPTWHTAQVESNGVHVTVSRMTSMFINDKKSNQSSKVQQPEVDHVNNVDTDSDDLNDYASGDGHGNGQVNGNSTKSYANWCFCGTIICFQPKICKYFGNKRCRCVEEGSDMHRIDDVFEGADADTEHNDVTDEVDMNSNAASSFFSMTDWAVTIVTYMLLKTQLFMP